MQAVRKNRYVILPKDFEKAYKKVVKKRDTEFDFYKWGLDDGVCIDIIRFIPNSNSLII